MNKQEKYNEDLLKSILILKGLKKLLKDLLQK